MSIYISGQYADYNDNYSCVIYDTDTKIRPSMVFYLKLTMEIDQPGTLEMTLAKEHPFNKMDYKKKRVVRVFNNGDEIWRGYPVKTETDFYGNKIILCDGCLACLKNIITEYPEYITYRGENADLMFDYYRVTDLIKYAFSHIFKGDDYSNKIAPFDINYFCGDVHKDYVGDKDSVWVNPFGEEDNRYTTLDEFLRHRLTDQYGGYLIYDFSPPGVILEPDPIPPSEAWHIGYLSSSNDYESLYYDDGKSWYNSYKCCFFKTLDELREAIRRGHVKVLEKGKNIIDFKKSVDISEIFTGVFPIGEDGILINGRNVLDWNFPFQTISENVVIDEEAAKVLGQIIKIQNFSDIKDKTLLKDTASAYLKNNLFKNINLEISFFDDAILSNDGHFTIPGNSVCYKYGDELSGNFIYNIICHSVEIDFLNPSKSVWKTFVDSEKLSNKYDDSNKSKGIYYMNSVSYEVEYDSNKDEEIT